MFLFLKCHFCMWINNYKQTALTLYLRDIIMMFQYLVLESKMKQVDVQVSCLGRWCLILVLGGPGKFWLVTRPKFNHLCTCQKNQPYLERVKKVQPPLPLKSYFIYPNTIVLQENIHFMTFI